jgi:hypothetical protein
MPTVPVDGRAQFDPSTIMVVNAQLGRWPLTAGVETVTPGGSYILRNSWPPAPTTNRWSGGGMSSRAVEPETPKTGSTRAASALWPHLK